MPGHLNYLQANVAQLNGVALGKQPRRLTWIGRLDAPHRSLLLDIRMRHCCVLATQLVQGVGANGGPNSSDTANMVGVTVRTNGAEHLHIGMLGSNMFHQTLAFPRGVDNHALIVRNNSIAIGLNGTVYERLDLDRSLGS